VLSRTADLPRLLDRLRLHGCPIRSSSDGQLYEPRCAHHGVTGRHVSDGISPRRLLSAQSVPWPLRAFPFASQDAFCDRPNNNSVCMAGMYFHWSPLALVHLECTAFAACRQHSRAKSCQFKTAAALRPVFLILGWTTNRPGRTSTSAEPSARSLGLSATTSRRILSIIVRVRGAGIDLFYSCPPLQTSGVCRVNSRNSFS
jgi:hypothetical protein